MRRLFLAAVLLCAGVAAASAQTSDRTLAKATLAGGCFWCMEPPYDKLEGVVSTTSGYIGGSKAKATYDQVSAGGTGHYEAVEIVYDPQKVSFERLLDVFWHNIDPLDGTGQFCDKGDQYRSAIFFHDEAQKRAAETSKKALAASERLPAPIVTEILPATAFYAAEDYHQDYYLNNPVRYRYYRFACGRDARLKELWGDQAGK
jgi:peptide-methionine (S)-S-oxide reductase